MTYFVYKITNTKNGKIYVGKTSDVNTRWSKHQSTSRAKNPNDYSYLHRAINKYGADSFSIQTIGCYDSEVTALSAEIHYIKLLHSQDCSIGYNLTEGGEGISGYKHSEESNEKNRQAHLGKTVSPEVRKKMSVSRTGGKRTEATKQKMREARAKQPPMSEESKRKLSVSKTGIKMSTESSIKKSSASLGEKNPSAKITEEDVIAVKFLKRNGKKRSQIQKLLHIPLSIIDRIIYGQSWTHVKVPDDYCFAD